MNPARVLILATALFAALGCSGQNVNTDARALRQGIASGDHAANQGRLALAESLYASAVEQAALSGDPVRMYEAVTRHAGMLARLGRTAEAIETLEVFSVLHEPEDPQLAHVQLLIARISLLDDDLQTAAQHAQSLSDARVGALPDDLRNEVPLLRALIAAHGGDADRAQSILDGIEARAPTSAQRADRSRCRALVAHHRGDHASAAAHYLAETRLHIRAVRPDASARSMASAAREYELLGDHASACRLFIRAGASYASLGRTDDALREFERAETNARTLDDPGLIRMVDRERSRID